MKRARLALPLLAFIAAAAVIARQSKDQPADKAATLRPVVVELFTSQGCSSCPPADALITRLAREPGVVAITRPVTYWDGLGWKDTLARPGNTDLQRAYDARQLPGGGVYTPEAVIQGRYGAIGSDERQIRSRIAQARRLGGPTLTVNGRQLTVSGGQGHARIQLISLQPMVSVHIGRGENGGREVRYADVLTGETTIGSWSGGTMHFRLPADARATGRAAILLRAGPAGPILAAKLL